MDELSSLCVLLRKNEIHSFNSALLNVAASAKNCWFISYLLKNSLSRFSSIFRSRRLPIPVACYPILIGLFIPLRFVRILLGLSDTFTRLRLCLQHALHLWCGSYQIHANISISCVQGFNSYDSSLFPCIEVRTRYVKESAETISLTNVFTNIVLTGSFSR